MLIALAACVALYARLFVGLFFGQRKILFRCDAAEVDPATLGLKAKTLRLKTEDGESLLAWSIPPAPGRPSDPLFSRQCRRARPARRALSRHGQGGHGVAGDRISRLRQLNRLSKRARTQARRRSGLCGGDRERRRAGAHRPSRGVAWIRGCGRARRAPQGWRARARLALFVDRRRRGGRLLVRPGSRIAPRSVPQRLADRLGQRRRR